MSSRTPGPRIATLLVVACLIIAGCADNKKASPKVSKKPDRAVTTTTTANVETHDPAANPCILLESKELRKAFGTPFAQGALADTSSNSWGEHLCTWTSTEANPSKTFTLSVISTSYIPEDLRKTNVSPKTSFAQAKSLTQASGQFEELPGVGDAAFLANKTRAHVLYGDIHLIAGILFEADAKAIAGLKALTETAASRL